MKNEKQLAEAIVSLMDELHGERSVKAKYLAADIAGCAKRFGNESMARVFEQVADHYRY